MFGRSKKAVAVAVAETEGALSPKKMAEFNREIEEMEEWQRDWESKMESSETKSLATKLLEMYRIMLLEKKVFSQRKGNRGFRKAEERKREFACDKLRRALEALKEGFYPYEPPQEGWCVGLVKVGKSDYDAWEELKEEKGRIFLFPSQRNGESRIFYFTGFIPPEVTMKYSRAEEIFGWPNIVVYTMQKEDLEEITIPSSDPMMIARIQDIPGFGTLYFRITSWGLSDDLKSLFGEDYD